MNEYIHVVTIDSKFMERMILVVWKGVGIFNGDIKKLKRKGYHCGWSITRELTECRRRNDRKMKLASIGD